MFVRQLLLVMIGVQTMFVGLVGVYSTDCDTATIELQSGKRYIFDDCLNWNATFTPTLQVTTSLSNVSIIVRGCSSLPRVTTSCSQLTNTDASGGGITLSVENVIMKERNALRGILQNSPTSFDPVFAFAGCTSSLSISIINSNIFVDASSSVALLLACKCHHHFCKST